MMKPATDNNNLVIKAHFEPQNMTLKGDEDRLEQILLNLIRIVILLTPLGRKIDFEFGFDEIN